MKAINLDIYIYSNYVHTAKFSYTRDSTLNILFEDIIVFSYERENDSTIYPGDIMLDVSYYYSLSYSSYDFRNYELPFIIDEDNKMFWDVHITSCRIDDFLYTHQIRDGRIRFKEWIQEGILPTEGVTAIKDVIQLWEECHVTFQSLSAYITVALGLLEVIKRVKSLFIKRKISPYPLLDVIFTKEEWNHYMLSELLKIDKEDTKNLLQGLGYQWDNSKKLYVKSPVAYEIREKLSKYSLG